MVRAGAGYALFSSHGTFQIHQGWCWEETGPGGL